MNDVEINKEVLLEVEKSLDNIQTNSETSEVETETDESITQDPSQNQNFTIIIDGQESNYLIESYKEMKVTNLYLQLILIAIVLIFVLSKFYYFCKSIFRVNF